LLFLVAVLLVMLALRRYLTGAAEPLAPPVSK
jgi:hypothetical protein